MKAFNTTLMKTYTSPSSPSEDIIEKINTQEIPLNSASSALITMKMMQVQYEHQSD